MFRMSQIPVEKLFDLISSLNNQETIIDIKSYIFFFKKITFLALRHSLIIITPKAKQAILNNGTKFGVIS